MKHLLIAIALVLPSVSSGLQGNINEQLVTELTVGELRGIIRELINQTLERCIVEGVMEGKSSITLRVVGDVRADIKCIE